MYTYNPERLHGLRPELDHLIAEHHLEVGLHGIPLDPDWARYEWADYKQTLFCVGCRKEGVLVGYTLWFLSWNIHHRSLLHADNDVIYLMPEHRLGRNGLRLIDESESLLRAQGVDYITWHVTPSNNWSAILERRGYDLEERVLGKHIGH